MTTENRIYVASLAIEYSPLTARESGAWIDIDSIDSWDEIISQLAEQLNIKEGSELFKLMTGGDTIVKDSEGLASEFVSQYGSFNVDDFVDARDAEGDDQAKAAFILCFGSWDSDGFENAYRGEWESEVAYAENLIEDCYDIEKMMGKLAAYFDYQAFARDLFINDCVMENGHVFDRNW